MKIRLNFWMLCAAEPHEASKNSSYPEFTLKYFRLITIEENIYLVTTSD
jgi:hypothetical protein